MPGTFGVPLLNVSIMPFSASQANSPGKASPLKNGRQEVVLGRIAHAAQLGRAAGGPASGRPATGRAE